METCARCHHRLGRAAIASPSRRAWADNCPALDAGELTVVDGSHQTAADRSYVEIAAPDDDCAFYSSDAQIANATVARSAISEEARFTPEYLRQVAAMFPRIVPAGASVASNTVDTSGAWPIRTVTYRAGDQAHGIHGAGAVLIALAASTLPRKFARARSSVPSATHDATGSSRRGGRRSADAQRRTPNRCGQRRRRG